MTTPSNTQTGWKGTPGPWGIEHTDGNLWIGPMRSDYRKIHTIVCDVDWSGSYREESKQNRLANAHLLAASPELLAACKAASALLESLPEDYAVVESALYDAIRKAESRS